MKSLTSAPPLNVTLAPQDYPPIDQVILVTEFDEAVEILRSSKFKFARGSRSIRVAVDSAGKVVRTATYEQAKDDPETEPWEELLRHGDLTRLNGAVHMQRRRALNPLFGRDAHLWFRDKVILPGLARSLTRALNSPDADGTVRADLVTLCKRVFIQAAAALVGFDGSETAGGADALIELHARIEGGRQLVRYQANNSGLEEHMQRVLDGRTELVERFYRPSLENRRQLVARHRAGGVGELPHDLLTLIASEAISVDDLAGVALAMSLMNGATGTNTQVVARSVAYLDVWFGLHPKDHEARTDPTFLQGALQEVIRLHGDGMATFSRMALEDVTLSNGRVIKAGQYVALIKDRIGRDKAVFGPDADHFEPRRIVPTGVYPFGLGFGSGSHMCIGLPLVLGQGGLTGFQVPVLQALYAAGIRPDPARSAKKRVETLPHLDEYATFPVIFERGG